MTDMPEKIWAWYFAEGSKNEVMHGGWTPEIDRMEVEYTRADIAQAQLDAKDAEIERLSHKEQIYHATANTYAGLASDLAEWVEENCVDHWELEDIKDTLERIKRGGIINDIRAALQGEGK